MILQIPNVNNNYLYRDLINKLITVYGEEKEIFLILKATDNTIINIALTNNDLRYYSNIKVYKGTLKNSYLYLLTEEYKNISKELLVFLANITIKKLTKQEITQLLEVTDESYNKFLIGLTSFENKYSIQNLSNKIKFDINEFNINLKTNFVKVI